MSRNVSANLRGQFYDEESTDPFLTLFTLTHSSFGTIRLVNNSTDIVSNGNTFTAFPVRLKLPNDDNNTIRKVEIEFDNVSREIIDELRSVQDPIGVSLQLVLASAPSTIEIEYDELQLRAIEYTTENIKGQVLSDDFLNTTLGVEKYAPGNFPGIF